MKVLGKSPHTIEHAEHEATPHSPNLLQPTESAPNASATVAGNDERTRSGLRVMRTSPIILISCGVVFASLIFLLDLRAQTEQRDGQEARVSRAASSSPAQNPSASASMREEKVQANVPAAAPSPTATTPAPPAQEAALPAPASQNNVEELAHQPSAIAPARPASSEVKASGVEASRTEPSADEGSFTLQVGSFNDQAEAGERVAKLGSLGIPAYVARVEIPKRGIWYRVQAGSFKSREEAARYGAQLRSRGSVADFIITERRAS